MGLRRTMRIRLESVINVVAFEDIIAVQAVF